MSGGILGSSGGAGYKVTVAYECGRLIWWLGQGQNGIAVQAIAAIAASVATVVFGWDNGMVCDYHARVVEDLREPTQSIVATRFISRR